MHCNGKCYLLKKLRQAGETEKKENRTTQADNGTESMIGPIYKFFFHIQLMNIVLTPYYLSHLSPPASELIQPPQ